MTLAIIVVLHKALAFNIEMKALTRVITVKYFMLLLDLYSFLDCWKKLLLEQSPGDFTGTQTRGYQASLDFQSQFYSKETSSRVKKVL